MTSACPVVEYICSKLIKEISMTGTNYDSLNMLPDLVIEKMRSGGSTAPWPSIMAN